MFQVHERACNSSGSLQATLNKPEADKMNGPSSELPFLFLFSSTSFFFEKYSTTFFLQGFLFFLKFQLFGSPSPYRFWKKRYELSPSFPEKESVMFRRRRAKKWLNKKLYSIPGFCLWNQGRLLFFFLNNSFCIIAQEVMKLIRNRCGWPLIYWLNVNLMKNQGRYCSELNEMLDNCNIPLKCT